MRNKAKQTMLLGYLIIVLVFVLASDASAAAIVWDGGGGVNHLWSDANNWNPDTVPTSDDTAQINVADANCLIDNTVAAECTTLQVGNGTGPCYLNMTGGTLTTGGSLTVGDQADGNGIFIMSGGTVDTGTGRLWIGDGESSGNTCYGTLIMTGGVFTVGGDKVEFGKNPTGVALVYIQGGTLNFAGESCDFEIAKYGDATLTMTGGVINIDDHLKIGQGGGTGRIYLDGGTINVSNGGDDAIPMGGGSFIDITDGSLVTIGDNSINRISQLVGEGRIMAYGGAGVVIIVYDGDDTIVTGRLGDPNLAWGPRPGDGVTIEWTPTGPTLSWNTGLHAASHRVYFDPNEQKVIARSGCDVNSVSRTEPNYTIIAPLSPLALGETYYWAVDEVNGAGPPPGIWPGNVWEFTVANYINVEDFNSYANDGELEAVWTLSGSDISLETQIVRAGNSMKYNYTNGFLPYYSEAYANTTGADSLQVTQNWTTAGIKALAFYFYGNASNATEQMYVALRDTANKIAVVYYNDDPNDIKEPQWHEWNIELSDFIDINNVDLNNVSKVYIGFGNRNTPQQGGSGTVYFDDIRLYPTRCVPSFAPAGDIDNDCDVDYVDVNMVTSGWLERDYNGVGSDGALHNFPTDNSQWVYDAGRGSQCLQFDGIDDWVDLDDIQFNNFHDKTIALWVKVREFPSDSRYIFFFTTDDSYRIYLLTRPNQEQIRARFIEPYSDYPTGVNTWVHLAFVLRDTDEGCTGEFYTDGLIWEWWDRRPRHSGDAIGVNLGSSNDGGSGFINAVIDDFRVYNSALSATDIYDLYDGWEPAADMLLHYTFDETSGLIAHNSSTYEFYRPLLSPSELYQGEAKGERIINFKDFAILADSWLEIQLWP